MDNAHSIGPYCDNRRRHVCDSGGEVFSCPPYRARQQNGDVDPNIRRARTLSPSRDTTTDTQPLHPCEHSTSRVTEDRPRDRLSLNSDHEPVQSFAALNLGQYFFTCDIEETSTTDLSTSPSSCDLNDGNSEINNYDDTQQDDSFSDAENTHVTVGTLQSNNLDENIHPSHDLQLVNLVFCVCGFFGFFSSI